MPNWLKRLFLGPAKTALYRCGCGRWLRPKSVPYRCKCGVVVRDPAADELGLNFTIESEPVSRPQSRRARVAAVPTVDLIGDDEFYFYDEGSHKWVKQTTQS